MESSKSVFENGVVLDNCILVDLIDTSPVVVLLKVDVAVRAGCFRVFVGCDAIDFGVLNLYRA